MSFLMKHRPHLLFATLAFFVACGPPPGPSLKGAPVLKGPDGREYRVLSKGPYKAFYDASGRVERLEFDSNGDGKTDQVALYDGASSPRRVEVDSDFDGKTDRWETYDAERETGERRHVALPRRPPRRLDLPGPGRRHPAGRAGHRRRRQGRPLAGARREDAS